MKKIVFLTCLVFIKFAHALVTEDCWTRVRLAEENLIEYPYSECYFDAGKKALDEWGKIALENGYKRALYELCRRYWQYKQGYKMCQESAELGHIEVLAQMGIAQQEKGNIQKAHELFKQIIPLFKPSQNPVVSEQIGFYYAKVNRDMKSALPYLEQASLNRSALANNILAVHTFLDILKDSEAQEKNIKSEKLEKLYSYLWRAILLDCPMAEENLGIIGIFLDENISSEQAQQELKMRMFTCTKKTEAKEGDYLDFSQCDCPVVLDDAQRQEKYPFKVLSVVPGVSALLEDKGGVIHNMLKGASFLGGKIQEIHESSIFYVKDTQEIIPVYTKDFCLEYCYDHPTQVKKLNLAERVEIRPYRLKFNRKECKEINYYAPLLVDTRLPYIGQVECLRFR